MHASARHAPTARTFLRLAWGMLVACLLATSLPALAANGRNPSISQAARAASVAKAASQAARVAQVTQAAAMPSTPRPQR